MKNTLKKKIPLIVGISLIIIGVVILILPNISKEQIKQQSMEIVKQVEEKTTVKELKDNLETPTTFEFEEIKSIGLTETLQSITGTKVNYKQLIGQVVIPSIEINLPLFNGLTNNNLLAGVATMKPKQVMGEKNYTIAGHYVLGGNYLFSNLVDIKQGAIVRVTNKETIFEYKIYKTSKVPANSLYLLEDKEAEKHGSPIISLMSCYYYNNNDVRWFAFGELINSYPYTKEKMESIN